MFNIFKKVPTLDQELESLLEVVRRKRIDAEEDECYARKQKEYYREREARIKAELGHDNVETLISNDEISARLSTWQRPESA